MSPFLIVFACLSIVFAQEQEVFNQCIDLPVVGSLCIRVTSRNCFLLIGTVSLQNEAIAPPKEVPIGTLLSDIQRSRDQGQNVFCQSFNLGKNFPGFQCSLCSTVNDLNVTGDNLHYCGSITVNCSNPVTTQNYVQTFKKRCVDIKNCKLFGCRNHCNNEGTCTSLGICQCNEGHYGLDCSVLMENNCIQSSTFQRTCYKADFPDCRTIDLEISIPSGEVFSKIQNIDENEILELVPCQSLSENVQCQTCVYASNLKVVGNELFGCPVVTLTCDGVDVGDYQMTCITLVKSDKLICPNSNSNTNSTLGSILGNAGTGKTVLLILASALGILFLGGIGYFVVTKYFGFDPNPFRQVDVIYTEDEAPLKMGGNEDISEDI